MLHTTYFLKEKSKIQKFIRGCIQKFPDWANNEINNNNKHSLRNNTKGYGGKTNYTDPQNSGTTAPSGTELYHLQFSLQAASPKILDTPYMTMNSTHSPPPPPTVFLLSVAV
jgi:hypothetical protein